jgi:lipopolysaccharide assembly outer membrane protein LptD (OstA)
MTGRAIRALAVLGVVLCGVSLLAQQKPDAAKTTQPVKYDTYKVDADKGKGAWGNQKQGMLTGHVVITHGDTVFKSDQMESYKTETEEKVISPGKFTVTDPRCDITADKGTAFLSKKLALAEGNVIMLFKPKEEQKTDKSTEEEDARAKLTRETTITCDRTEYFYKDKIASAAGKVVFTQNVPIDPKSDEENSGKRVITADKAKYDQNTEIVTLTGHVEAVDEKGQTFSSPGPVVISIKKGDEWIEADNVKATVKVKSSQEEQ